MAHARRYFKEALPTAAVACAQALALIKQLYGIERVASDRQLDAPARQGSFGRSRRGRCWSRTARHLLEQRAAALPKSPLGAVTGYALRNWAALTCYTEDGRLKIDNNGAEQALRPIVLGRKNFGCSRAVKRQRTGPPSCVHSSRPASTCRSIPSSTCAMSSSAFRLHPARLVLELDAARVEAPAAALRTSRRLNGGLLIIRPRLRPVSSISIYVSIATRPPSSLSTGWTVEMEL